eukprot:g32911.t1
MADAEQSSENPCQRSDGSEHSGSGSASLSDASDASSADGADAESESGWLAAPAIEPAKSVVKPASAFLKKGKKSNYWDLFTCLVVICDITLTCVDIDYRANDWISPPWIGILSTTCLILYVCELLANLAVRDWAFLKDGDPDEISELQALCGLVLASNSAQLLPRNAAEALLRCNEFDVQAAATAFRRSPRDALDAAGLRGLDLQLANAVDTREINLQDTLRQEAVVHRSVANLCIVCFDEVDPMESTCRLFLCKHVICDNCLSMHIKVRLDEGDVAGEQSRFEQLKTLKFVDMSKNLAWCPSPGCGRAVSWPRQERSDNTEKAKATTVICSCGTSFCFTCKHLGGHEPAPCQTFSDFLKNLAVETHQWLSKNSKTCTCGAIIQRSGGCNHMICSVCGRHFCYVCGQDWAPHRGQPGGFDYYACRLPNSESCLHSNTTERSPNLPAPASEEHRKLSKLERECLPGWTANERQPDRLKLLFRALLCQAAWEALLACLKARRCLQNCYVLKYHWAVEQWRRSRLSTWVPELEGIVGALESALGLTLLQSEAVKAGFPTSAEVAATGASPKQLPKNPKDILRLFDLRPLLPQVIDA